MLPEYAYFGPLGILFSLLLLLVVALLARPSMSKDDVNGILCNIAGGIPD